MGPSLYAHVPFCASRCSYCDFHSNAVDSGCVEALAERWLVASERHLASLVRRFGVIGFDTVYVGGGTPSCLPLGTLTRFLGAIASTTRGTIREWTVEANPEDVDGEFLDTISAAGVNRLSVGVQSLEPYARSIAARRGDADEARKRLERIAATWKAEWSADLIYGLPGQTPEGLARDAAYLASLGLGHVSLYELTLEHGTPLWRKAEDGSVRMPDEDERFDQYDAAADALRGAGFARYEVSNWALPGRECVHNGRYWNMDDWLAIGPAGVGNVAMPGGSYLRLENSSDDEAYYADPTASVHEAAITGLDAAFETLMTALRTSAGFDRGRFSARFGLDAFSAFGRLHELFPDLVGDDGRSWRATDRGLDTLNIVLISALSEAERYYKAIASKSEGTMT